MATFYTLCVLVCLIFCSANAFDFVMNVTGANNPGRTIVIYEGSSTLFTLFDSWDDECLLIDSSSGETVVVARYDNTWICDLSSDLSTLVVPFRWGDYTATLFRYDGSSWNEYQKIPELNGVSGSFPDFSAFLPNDDLILWSDNSDILFILSDDGTSYESVANISIPSTSIPSYLNIAVNPSGTLLVLLTFSELAWVIDLSDYSYQILEIPDCDNAESFTWLSDDILAIGDPNYDREVDGELRYNWGILNLYKFNGTAFNLHAEYTVDPEDLYDDVLLDAYFGEDGLEFGSSCAFHSGENLLVCDASYSVIAIPWDPVAEEIIPNTGVDRERITRISSSYLPITTNGDTVFISDTAGDRFMTPSICYCYFKRGECVDSDQCTDCFSGSYGTECDACECQNNGACDDGFSGTGSCDCSGTGYWGEYCENRCTCLNGICNATTGICTSAGCVRGYYGDNCDQTCTCVNGVCDRATGECVSDIPCFRGFGGPNCDQQCTCVNGACTDTLECKCFDGWAGDECSECDEGFYMSEGSCVECSCVYGDCEDDGSCTCVSGYSGPTCSTSINNPTPTPSATPTPSGTPTPNDQVQTNPNFRDTAEIEGALVMAVIAGGLFLIIVAVLVFLKCTVMP